MHSPASLKDVRLEAYPAKSRSVSGPVGGVMTSAMSVVFSDKIVVTIVQDGMGIAQWIEVPSGSIDSQAVNTMTGGGSSNLEDIEELDSDDEVNETSLQHQEDSNPSHTTPLSLLPPITNVPLAETLLGGGITDREVSAHYVSRQIAALIRSGNDSDSRGLLVGFGWKDKKGIDIGFDGLKAMEDLMNLIVQIASI